MAIDPPASKLPLRATADTVVRVRPRATESQVPSLQRSGGVDTRHTLDVDRVAGHAERDILKAEKRWCQDLPPAFRASRLARGQGRPLGPAPDLSTAGPAARQVVRDATVRDSVPSAQIFGAIWGLTQQIGLVGSDSHRVPDVIRPARDDMIAAAIAAQRRTG